MSMKKVMVLLSFIIGINLQADLVSDGLRAYQHGDYRSARGMWTKSCDEGISDACYNLANIYMNGKGMKREEKMAADIYSRLCESGDMSSCNNLGVIYERGVGVPQSFFRSSRLYAKACNAGDVNGCVNLGAAYYEGRGVMKDYKIASELYEQTCNKGSVVGCYALGGIYRRGKGLIPKNESKAKGLYKKGCVMGSSACCRKYRRLDGEGIK